MLNASMLGYVSMTVAVAVLMVGSVLIDAAWKHYSAKRAQAELRSIYGKDWG